MEELQIANRKLEVQIAYAGKSERRCEIPRAAKCLCQIALAITSLNRKVGWCSVNLELIGERRALRPPPVPPA
jgi:hypothetical protein